MGGLLRTTTQILYCLCVALITSQYAFSASTSRHIPKVDSDLECVNKYNAEQQSLTWLQDKISIELSTYSKNSEWAIACFTGETALIEKPLIFNFDVPVVIHGLNINTNSRVHLAGKFVSLQNVSITNHGADHRGALILEGRRHSLYDVTINGAHHENILGLNALRADGELMIDGLSIHNFDIGAAFGGSDTRVHNMEIVWEHETPNAISGSRGMHLSPTRSQYHVLNSIKTQGYREGIELGGNNHKARGITVNGLAANVAPEDQETNPLPRTGLDITGNNHLVESLTITSTDNEPTIVANEIRNVDFGVKIQSHNSVVKDTLFAKVSIGIETTGTDNAVTLFPNSFSEAQELYSATEGTTPYLNKLHLGKECFIDEHAVDCSEAGKISVNNIYGSAPNTFCNNQLDSPPDAVLMFVSPKLQSFTPAAHCTIDWLPKGYLLTNIADGTKLTTNESTCGFICNFPDPIDIDSSNSHEIALYAQYQHTVSPLLPQLSLEIIPNLDSTVIVPGAVTMTPLGGDIGGAIGGSMDGGSATSSASSGDTVTIMPTELTTLSDPGLSGTVVDSDEGDASELQATGYVDNRTPPQDNTPFSNATNETPAKSLGCSLIIR